MMQTITLVSPASLWNSYRPKLVSATFSSRSSDALARDGNTCSKTMRSLDPQSYQSPSRSAFRRSGQRKGPMHRAMDAMPSCPPKKRLHPSLDLGPLPEDGFEQILLLLPGHQMLLTQLLPEDVPRLRTTSFERASRVAIHDDLAES
mmetsp:Transcript_1820/g.6675  ORF Transcript_1820/g.6675 Transcript_1820/m.6675 type:complete len:147 (+) Transcript_1820:517-957(+)